MSDSPIRELQIKQTYLERHVEEQDRVIYALQAELEKLRRQVARLNGKIEAAASPKDDLASDEKPPHY